jgi:hypothetical protein
MKAAPSSRSSMPTRAGSSGCACGCRRPDPGAAEGMAEGGRLGLARAVAAGLAFGPWGGGWAGAGALRPVGNAWRCWALIWLLEQLIRRAARGVPCRGSAAGARATSRWSAVTGSSTLPRRSLAAWLDGPLRLVLMPSGWRCSGARRLCFRARLARSAPWRCGGASLGLDLLRGHPVHRLSLGAFRPYLDRHPAGADWRRWSGGLWDGRAGRGGLGAAAGRVRGWARAWCWLGLAAGVWGLWRLSQPAATDRGAIVRLVQPACRSL